MGWVTQKTSETVLISRRAPVRFDVCVKARFPFTKMGRLAYQIRQDMWSTMQILRGFLPATEISKITFDLSVRAGWQLTCPVHLGHAEECLCELLHDPQMRSRWFRFAVIEAEVVRC